MSNAVRCAGCAAALAVPPGAAGKVLRCPRCATLNPIPAEPEPEYEPEPPPRVRAERSRRERDDRDEWDDDRPRRRKPAGVPGWVWAVAVSVAGVAAVVVLGLVLARRGGGPDRSNPQVENPPPDPKQLAEQGMLPEAWVRKTHEPSGASWEFPTTGECWDLHSVVRVADQKPLSFTVTVKDVPLVPKVGLSPVESLRKAAPGGDCAFGPVESTRTIDGRPAAVIRAPNFTTLAVAEPGRTWEFQVSLPQRDEGGERVRRFFDSVRINRPMPPDPSDPGTPVAGLAGKGKAPDSGEVIPAGWDRVQLPRTTLTLLMPKDPAPQWARKRHIPGGTSVDRAMVNAAGEEVVVSATYFEATQVGPAIGDPFGGVTQEKAMTVGGHPARLSVREFGGMSFVSLVIQPTPLKFIYVGVGGQAKITPDTPEAKRVLDSLSFTLPPKAGPDAPENYDPAWTRRYAPGGTFSVELPGPTGPASEGGVGLGGGVAWTSKGRLPLRDDKFGLHFTASAIGGLGAVPDPRKAIEQEIELLPRTKGAPQFVRRVDVAGRPGYVAAKTTDGGMGSVRLKLQDRTMMYQLDAVGRGLTPDSPQVKRFLDSVRFDLARPAGTSPGVLEVPVPKGP